MEPESLNDRLSRIQTLWTLVRNAHEGPADAVRAAQQQLLDRYGGAVRRYLRGVVRDGDAAEDLFQEFACRVLKGDLHGADPERGRFRQYVKGVLFHLVADHHQAKKRQPAVGENLPEPAVGPPSMADLDRDLVQSWRDELLARTWQLLEDYQKVSGKPFFGVLRFRADHPKLSSDDMAGMLSKELGKPISAAGVRQTLHRARDKFADLLLDEVLHALDKPESGQVEEELIELGLLDYCRPALERKSKNEP
jgi:RNA polymerase sigma-70 factor (ECF subfamily)